MPPPPMPPPIIPPPPTFCAPPPMPPAPKPPPCMPPPICASTGTPANPAGSRSVSGRSERLVTTTCAVRESLGMNLTLTSPAASAARMSWASASADDEATRGPRATAGAANAASTNAAAGNNNRDMVEPFIAVAGARGFGRSWTGHADPSSLSTLLLNRLAGAESAEDRPEIPVLTAVMSAPGSSGAANQRLENCVPRRAPRRPYFFRSFIRPSRVSRPP